MTLQNYFINVLNENFHLFSFEFKSEIYRKEIEGHINTAIGVKGWLGFDMKITDTYFSKYTIVFVEYQIIEDSYGFDYIATNYGNSLLTDAVWKPLPHLEIKINNFNY